MPKVDIDVGYVAGLCRLRLSEDEEKRFEAQLGRVLDYMRQIDDLDVTGIEPTAHAFPVYDVLRGDEPESGLSREEALENAPQVAHEQFVVPKVVE